MSLPLVLGARRTWGPGGCSGVRHLGVTPEVRIRIRDLSRRGQFLEQLELVFDLCIVGVVRVLAWERRLGQ